MGLHRDGTIQYYWDDAAGLCSLLSCFGAHLVEVLGCVNPYCLGLRPPDRIPVERARADASPFGVFRGRLGTPTRDGGVELQPIRGDEPRFISPENLSEEELALRAH